jgi:hypothetical protein
MRVRYVVAAALAVIPAALVAWLFAFSAHMQEKARALGDFNMRVDSAEMLLWDTAMFWGAWGWVIGPAVVVLGLGLALAVVMSGRRRQR